VLKRKGDIKMFSGHILGRVKCIHIKMQRNNSEKKNKINGLLLPDFKNYKATANQTAQHLQKDEKIDQQNRTDSRNGNIYGQLIFNNTSNAIQWRKNSVFHKLSEQLDIHMQKYECGPIPLIIYEN